MIFVQFCALIIDGMKSCFLYSILFFFTHYTYAQISEEQKLDFINCAHEAMSRHDFEAAIKVYSNLLEINPSDTSSYFDRAMLQSEYGNEEAAIADFNTCIMMDSNEVDFFFLRGISYNNLADYKHAESDLKYALTLEPNNADMHMHFANALLGLGKTEAALHEFEKAVDLKSENASLIHLKMARIFLAQKRHDEYLSFLKRAADISEDNIEASLELVGHFIKLNKTEDAGRYLFRAMAASKELKFDLAGGNYNADEQKACYQVIMKTPCGTLVDSMSRVKSLIYLGMLDSVKSLMQTFASDTTVAVHYLHALLKAKSHQYDQVLKLCSIGNSDYAERISSLKLWVYQQTKNKDAYCQELRKYNAIVHRYFDIKLCAKLD